MFYNLHIGLIFASLFLKTNTKGGQTMSKTTKDLGDGTTLVQGNCVFTGEAYACLVPTAGLQRWRDGELIQRALPSVSPENREFIISGISPTGWDRQFGQM